MKYSDGSAVKLGDIVTILLTDGGAKARVVMPGCKHRVYRALSLLILATGLAGCRSYAESTPSRLLEGNHPANYARVFREPVPSGVTVVNSAVVVYSFRPGVVTTDDFEFELVVPSEWIRKATKRFYLGKRHGEFIQKEIASRQELARSSQVDEFGGRVRVAAREVPDRALLANS